MALVQWCSGYVSFLRLAFHPLAILHPLMEEISIDGRKLRNILSYIWSLVSTTNGTYHLWMQGISMKDNLHVNYLDIATILALPNALSPIIF